MSLPEFSPPMTPSVGVTRRPEINLLKAEFGDGYSQTAPNGLNHIRDVLQLRWDVLTKDEADDIEGFLHERGGYQSFYYRLPYATRIRELDQDHYEATGETVYREVTATAVNASIKKFTCEEWQVTQPSSFHYAIEATLRESFTLER